ncbi:MAG: C25 family cysteine peptidase [bacterium]
MKKLCIITTLAFLSLCGHWAIASIPSASPMTTEILSATPHATLMRCIFDEAVVAAALSSEEGGISDEGFATILAIAGAGIPQARILHLELGEEIAAASANDLPRNADEIVTLSEPAILRDLRVVAARFYPALAQEHSVRAVRSLDVEIVTNGTDGPNPKAVPRSFSFAFYPLYRAIVGNLDELYPEVSLGKPGRFVVIGPTAWMNSIPSSWRIWKQRKGYELILAPYSVMGDSSITGIYNYVHTLYHEPNAAPLEYAILLGDATGYNIVPAFRVQNPESPEELDVADNPFFTVDGTDYLPDVFHGRISVATASEIMTVFNKVTNYEMTPDIENPGWLTRGIGIAGNYNDGAGTFPVTPVWNVIWAREQLLAWAYSEVDTFYWRNWNDGPPEQYTPWICNAWNEGASIVVYRGWGNARGWQYPSLFLEDLTNIQCRRKTPALFSIVCGSGDFGHTTVNPCFGEKLLRLGSPNTPNGVVSFYGASDLHTNTKQNNAILGGLIDGMRFNGLRSMGAITLSGELELFRSFPDQAGDGGMVEFYFDVFNVLGDPETHLWLGNPQSLDVTAPSSVGTGERYIAVTVTSQGSPLKDAVVTIRGTTWDLQSTVLTDANGYAMVPITIEGSPPLQLTVWKAGYLPENRDISFASGPLELCIFSAGFSGGGDALPNPGETVDLALTIGNMGPSASGVQAELSSLDPKITITSGQYAFGDFPANTTQTQTTPFAIELADDLREGEEPQLRVRFTDDASHTTDRVLLVPVRAPLLVPTYIYADDANELLDPGETADMIVNLTNFGRQNAEDVTATLYSWDNSIEILDGNGAWGTIATGDSGRNSENVFQIRAQSGTTRGREIVLRLDHTANGIFQGTRLFTMTIGQVQAVDPTGPDDYGYRAYEDLDAGFSATPTFDWIELDPAYGGSGAQAHQVHDEDLFALSLPQAFTYYGEDYDTIWVCSNGWLSFGAARLAEFRNWPLPAPIGAPALVAPLWDDLTCWDSWLHSDSVFTIFTRHDAAEHRFIIEWSRSANRYGWQTQTNYEETFEVILEYPETSGDGSLLFQYLTVSNVDANNNYFTTGIEDYDHQRGLNLTYANTYPTSMHPIAAGRAIRITTTPPDEFSSVDDTVEPLPMQFALQPPYPNPFNATTTLRYAIPQSGLVRLTVLNIMGQKVASLVDSRQDAGYHSVSWNATNMASGVYICQLQTASQTVTQKMLLLK